MKSQLSGLLYLCGLAAVASAATTDLCRCETSQEHLYSRRLGYSHPNYANTQVDRSGYYIVDGIRVLPSRSNVCYSSGKVESETKLKLGQGIFKCPMQVLSARNNLVRELEATNLSSPVQDMITIMPDTPFEQLAHKYLSTPVTSAFFSEFLQQVGATNDQADLESFADVNSSPSDPQIVYLKFTTEGNFTVRGVTDLNDPDNTTITEFGPYPLYNYTEEEKVEIAERLRKDYERFANIAFVLEQPSDGEDFSTLEFNARTNILVKVDETNLSFLDISVQFGLADAIDFLNLNASDYASVDANFWSFLLAIGRLDLFYANTGFSPDDDNLTALLALAVLNQSANTAAHELGHILGLRHIDSIGAPGDGLPSTGEPQNEEFVPAYKGPRNATETFLHLLASGASVNLPGSASANSDRFFSERSAIKLSLAFHGATILSESEAVLNGLSFSNLTIPNTLLEGENFGSSFLQAGVGLVLGRISDVDEVDQYRISLQGDRFLTTEVMSLGNSNIGDKVIARLTVFLEEADGVLTKLIEASQEFETQDPLLFDFFIAATGTYILQVDAPDIVYLDDGPVNLTSLDDGAQFLTGDYLLFSYSYNAPMDIVEDLIDPTIDPKPTQLPSQEPTQVPTKEPTTGEDTLEPTKEPTTEKTLEPTKEPTEETPPLDPIGPDPEKTSKSSKSKTKSKSKSGSKRSKSKGSKGKSKRR